MAKVSIFGGMAKGKNSVILLIMRTILSIVILLSCLSSFAQPQKREAFKFIDSVFHDSACQFEITEFDFPADIRDILLRFNNSLAANQEWFKQYVAHVPAGQPLPYDERFGITREEYGRIRNMDKVHPALKVVDTQKITILRRDGRISFNGEGDGRILDYLEFYIDKNELIFAGDTIPFVPGINISAAATAYGLSDGYAWRLETTDAGKSLQAGRLTARVVEIDLGIHRPDNKPLLRIQYQDMENGVNRANLDLAGYIGKRDMGAER